MPRLPRCLPRARRQLANARDVGAAAPGLVRGVLLRSEAPRQGDQPPTGLAWPPRTVLDLRDPSEAKQSHALARVAELRSIPLIEEASFQHLMAGEESSLAKLYSAMIDAPEAAGFSQVVDAVATAPGPILAHCTAGKDRTGVAVALVLSLVGAPREAIIADYIQTAANMRPVMARIIKELPLHKRLVARFALGSVEQRKTDRPADAGRGAGFMARVETMLGAPAEAITVVLDAWDAHPGGAEGWYFDHGGDRATLDALRARLIAR